MPKKTDRLSRCKLPIFALSPIFQKHFFHKTLFQRLFLILVYWHHYEFYTLSLSLYTTHFIRCTTTYPAKKEFFANYKRANSYDRLTIKTCIEPKSANQKKKKKFSLFSVVFVVVGGVNIKIFFKLWESSSPSKNYEKRTNEKKKPNFELCCVNY